MYVRYGITTNSITTNINNTNIIIIMNNIITNKFILFEFYQERDEEAEDSGVGGGGDWESWCR